MALGVLGVAVLLRYLFGDALGVKVPYLHLFPAVIVAGWYGGLGPGLLTTTLSCLLAMYFLLPPDGWAVSDPADVLSLAVFAATGLVLSWLNHRVHVAEEGQRQEAATANARAERLDAILNISADGIIVIDAKGRIESFNRGAQQLFGYPRTKCSDVTSAS